MFSNFQKMQRLSADERLLLGEALVLLPLSYSGVHVLGVSRWQRVLTRLASLGKPSTHSTENSGARPDDAEQSSRARVIARIVKVAAHHGLFQASCLQQTLVLWYLLRRNCIESQIRFGARKEAGQLQAHAWVECFGIALNEDSEVCDHFSPFEGVTTVAVQS